MGAVVKTGIAVLAALDLAWLGATIAQVADAGGLDAGTVVPAGLTTMVTGALVWVFRAMKAGELVHRDPQHANTALADLVKRTTEALEAASNLAQDVSDKQGAREDRLYRLLEDMRSDGPRPP